MITVTTHQIANVTIYMLCKFGSIILELPARSIDYDKQAKFVARIHESRVLRTMSITNYFHSGITQFLGITPMDTVGNCITYHCKILMAVGTYQRAFIRLAIQLKNFLALKLHTTNTDTTAISVHYIPFTVTDTYVQII